MDPNEVRERLVEIGVPASWSPAPATSLDTPLPVSLPSGMTIDKDSDRDRIDSWLWTYVACQNKGDWFTTSHETDNYLRKALPTLSLETFDEFVARQEEDGSSAEYYLGIGGTFGWMTLEDGRIGVFYLSGIGRSIDGGPSLFYPQVEFLILIDIDSSYLPDDFVVVGDVRPPE